MYDAPVGTYLSRQGRARFIATNFACQLDGRVLDVGCGEAFLRPLVPGYVGCDIAGNPDVRVDLDKDSLPFAAQSFQTVICIDVLEHVEPLVGVFCELFRVAQENVIISLPNIYALGYRLRFLRGQVLSKEYSLEPRNRHKWLPGYGEARTLFAHYLPPGWRVAWEFGFHPLTSWRT